MQKYNEKDVIMEKGSITRRELAKHGWGHVYENPKFWPASCTKDFAVSLHMMGNDRWEEFDANVVFVLGEYGKKQTKLLGKILDELKEPVVLTIPLAVPANQQKLYKSLGFTLMPVRLTDTNEREHEVYIKGSMKMGGWANMMTRVEGIDSDIISIKRPASIIFFSFLSFKLSQVLRKTSRLFRV
jgi:hypothetical protein